MASHYIQTKPSFSRALFKEYTGMTVLMDENTSRHCYPLLRNQLPGHSCLVMPAGELYKNLDTCQMVWQHLTDHQLDRHGIVLVLGGGVLCDLGGFCASTYKRGIAFALVPTTLLAMADASVGGKTGIDFGSYKNHVGTFSEPLAIWAATDFLKTLPAPELRSGFGEIIKHALIADVRLWKAISKKSLHEQNFPQLVRHSVKFKTAITRKDPREKGLRKILNFGHSVGHGMESLGLYAGKPLLHGDAVAAGMVMEAHIAFGKKLLSSRDLEDITTYIIRVFGKVNLPDTDSLIKVMYQDKKNKGNTILMAFPKGIGKACFDQPVSEREIRDAAVYYLKYQT